MKYILPTVLGSAALVAAHGYVDTALIGGETYEFYQPYQDPYMSSLPERVSRSIPGNGPVEDVTSPDMTCGGGSKPAALHAKAAAGSTVELSWTLWAESHVGPVITYMARCPDAGCQDYQPGSDAVWFKVQEGGREGVTNTWAATPLMSAGGVAKYTIPECLSPGFYLVRHEIIALHAAAQFYPGCHQLEVTGSGSTVPSALVSFPGAYSATDPGIDYSPYQPTEYTIPGPALFSCGGSGGSGSTPPPAATTPSAPNTSAPVATTPPAASTPAPTGAPPTAEAPEDDCPADDGEEEPPVDDEDDCPVESEDVGQEGGLEPVATDNEDDCPAEEEDPAEPEQPEDPAEQPEDPAEQPEDDCPAEDDEATEPVDPVEDEDDCPAEDGEEAGAGGDDEYEDIDDCEPETVPTKRQTLHERRLN